MKTLPFLLLLACLLNTALSHPMFWSLSRQGQYREREISPTSLLYRSLIPCHQSFPTRTNTAAGLAHYLDPNTVVPGSFPATAVSQSADSTLEAASEDSFPAVTPVLPNDILLKITTCADITTVLPNDILLKITTYLDITSKCSLRATNKEFNALLPSFLKPADVDTINKSSKRFKALYAAILKNDVDTVKSQYFIVYRQNSKQLIYGLQLAVRYRKPQAAWIFLALTLEKMENDEELIKLRADAESQQTKTGLAHVAKLWRLRDYRFCDYIFLHSIILNKRWLAYGDLGGDIGVPSRGARLFGLELAVQYNLNALILLAFGTWDWDMHTWDWDIEYKEWKEIVDAAKGKLPQTDLDFLKKIQDSAPEKRDLWKNIVTHRRPSEAIVRDHDTAIVGMQLAVMSDSTEWGIKLLREAKPKLRGILINAATALATNADKSENLQKTWEFMKDQFDKKMAFLASKRNLFSSLYRYLFPN